MSADLSKYTDDLAEAIHRSTCTYGAMPLTEACGCHGDVQRLLKEPILARIVKDAKAEAWTEAYRHGVDDMIGTDVLDVRRRNPYRVTTS